MRAGWLGIVGCLVGLVLGLAIALALGLPGWALVLFVFASQITGGVIGLELAVRRGRR